MSQFYDQASLVVVPSGYKAGTVYAQKPLTTDGQLAFTRTGDTATRVNSAGMIEKVRTNLVLQSQAFENASWIKINATATANSTTAPDGTLTADTILAPSAISTAAYQGISSQGAMTLSLYAKANTSNFIALTIFDVSPAIDYMAIFDLSNGTFIGNGGFSSVDSYSIENAGNGWYRLSVTKDVGAVGNHNYVVGVAKTGNSAVPVAGTSVFVWGAQVEASDFGATAYIPTTTAAVSVGPVANVPRLDYLGSTCGKLLLEPQRTNLVTYSEQLDNAAWVKDFSGTGSVPVVTANYTTSPDGYQNADRVQFSAVGKTLTSDYSLIGQYPITLGATGTFSFYLKSLTSGNQNVLVYWGAGQGQVYVVTPQWQRFTLENCASGFAGIAFGTRGGTGFTAGGDQTLDIAIWGAQLETGAYATSYIPTLAATATRGADACSKTGISSLIGQTEGTVFVDWQIDSMPSIGSYFTFLLTQSSGNLMYVAAYPDGRAQAAVFVGNVLQCNLISSTGFITAGANKFAFGYKANDFVLYANGTQVATDTSGSVPAATSIDLADTSSGKMNYKQALLFKTRLSNAALAELTTL